MTTKTLLKFQSPQCNPCKALSAVLLALQQAQPELFQDTLVSEVCTDTYRELVKIHGVRSVPTLVLLDNTGKELKRMTGSTTSDKLKEFLL